MTIKDTYKNLISDALKPLLKANGFSKNGANFYRIKDDLIFLFNFQNSQGNTADQVRFYVNCAIHSTAIDKIIGKRENPTPKEYECYFRNRISHITQSAIDGYTITEETDMQVLAQAVLSDLQKAISMFDAIKSTQDLVNLMIERNGLNNYTELFEYLLLTENRADMVRFVKQLHNTFGKERRWAALASNLTDSLNYLKRKETVESILNDE